MPRARPLLLAFFVLAACGEDPQPEPVIARDPQVAQALNDPLMTDPDLSSRNEAAAALTVESDFSVPVLPATPEEIALARAEAARIAGGSGPLPAAPEPQGAGPALDAAAAPAQRLAALSGSAGGCRAALAASAIWAARMAAAMPIYPRGHVLDAAGSDAAGCKVRTVAFETPVPRPEVMAFYVARARAAGGEGPPLMRAGADWRLRGAAGRLAYDIYARPRGDRTLVRLTTLER